MTRDQLERAKQRLDQGLELPRDTVKALVAEALKHFPPRKHPDGCGWWSGGSCTCEPVAESIDLALKNALTEPAPKKVTVCATCGGHGGRSVSAVDTGAWPDNLIGSRWEPCADCGGVRL